MKYLQCLMLLVFFIVYNNILKADWVQTNGPGYGTVLCMAEKDNKIFASTHNGLFFTTNKGVIWNAANNGLTSFVTSLKVVGKNIFAGTSNGIFLSDNDGKNWIPENSGLNNLNIRSLSISGNNIFACTDSGISLSINNGKRWVTVFHDLPVNALAINGTNLFAATSRGLFISTDNCASWKLLNSEYALSDLVICGTNIIANTYYGLRFSEDGGKTWTNHSISQPAYHVRAFAVCGSHIFGGLTFEFAGYYQEPNGIYVSNVNFNGWGGRWANNGAPFYRYPFDIYSINVFGANIYAGTYLGAYLSTDSGSSWEFIGFPVVDHFSNVLSLFNNETGIFAGTWRQGIFHSANEGESWEHFGLGSPFSVGFEQDDYRTDVNVVYAFGNNIFAGTYYDYVFGHGGKVCFSTDHGSNWNYVLNVSFVHPTSFAVSGDNIFAGFDNGGIYLSTNGGLNWVKSDNGIPYAKCYSLVVKGTNIFAAAGGVYISSNNGTDWTILNNGIPNSARALAVSGINIFAGTSGGMFFSTNDGTNWVKINNGLTDTVVNVIAVRGSYIFAATNSGVFLSTNKGASWTNIGMAAKDIVSLSVSASNVFAATSQGVWKRPLSELFTINCPLALGYWKTHSNEWSAALPMMLGTSNTYDQSKLASIFTDPVNGDASIILADQLIAAKLNIANNSPLPAAVDNAITNSDAAIGNSIIPMNIKSNSALGQQMISLAAILADYNNGKLTADCHYTLNKSVDSPGDNSITGLSNKYELLGNFPNPFNPTTRISFILPEANFVTLKIYNSVGQLVRTLVNENMNKGYHSLEWNAVNDNGSQLAAGIYLYRLQAGNFVQTSKMIFMK